MMKTTQLIKRTLPYYKKYWKIMVFDLLCAGLTTICELVLPLIIKYFTNTAMEDVGSWRLVRSFYLAGFILSSAPLMPPQIIIWPPQGILWGPG